MFMYVAPKRWYKNANMYAASLYLVFFFNLCVQLCVTRVCWDQALIQKRYNFKMLYEEDGIKMQFSKRGSTVIVDNGCDEIMQAFMSG